MMVSKALRFTLYRRRPWNSIFSSNSLYTLLPSQVMGINGWSFSKERCTQTVLLYVRAEGFSSLSSQILDFRNPVQIYAANSVSRENAPEVPSQKGRTSRRRSCISIILGQPSVVEKVPAGQTSLLAVCGIPAISHCPPAHGRMYFSSVTQNFRTSSASPLIHISPFPANTATGKKMRLLALKKEK